MVVGDRSGTARRLSGAQAAAELRATPKAPAPRAKVPALLPSQRQVSFEALLTSLQMAASGNWVVQLLMPARERAKLAKLSELSGWRLRVTVKLEGESGAETAS